MTKAELNQGLANNVVYCLEMWDNHRWWCVPKRFKSPKAAETHFLKYITDKGNPYRVIKLETSTKIVKLINVESDTTTKKVVRTTATKKKGKMTNAEKYTTPIEQELAFLDFCNNKKDCEKCPLRGSPSCRFSWLVMDIQNGCAARPKKTTNNKGNKEVNND
jgi:hypothetical protein